MSPARSSAARAPITPLHPASRDLAAVRGALEALAVRQFTRRAGPDR